MEIRTNELLLLKKLSAADAEAFYQLYANPDVGKHFDQSPFLPAETAIEFTSRIIASCAFIWTIRLQNEPEEIIGDVALHHWDKHTSSIEIGGSLLPAYWGKSLMKEAFELVIDFAIRSLGVAQIIGRTNPSNSQAIRLVEKLGFQRVGMENSELILKMNHSEFQFRS